MSKTLSEYFQTDWSAMTRADWVGFVIVVLMAAVMTAVYVWVLKPGNKDKFEQYCDFVNQEDKTSGGAGHGQAK